MIFMLRLFKLMTNLHAQYVCTHLWQPKWLSVGMFTVGLVCSTIWLYLIMNGANVLFVLTQLKSTILKGNFFKKINRQIL